MRMAAGLLLISLAFIGPQNRWFLLGAIPLLTGVGDGVHPTLCLASTQTNRAHLAQKKSDEWSCEKGSTKDFCNQNSVLAPSALVDQSS